MWRSGDFVKSMFYSALKIKRPEVSDGTYFCPQLGERSQDFSAVEKPCVRLRTVERVLGSAMQSKKGLPAMEISMTKVHAGDKAVRDNATADQSNVRLGDSAPAFVRVGDKVVRDTASQDQGKVRLGDSAPVFCR
jgi:hypothetical protein